MPSVGTLTITSDNDESIQALISRDVCRSILMPCVKAFRPALQVPYPTSATMGFNLALPLLLLLVVDYTSCASLLFNPPPTTRRAALTNFVSAFAVAAAQNQKAFGEEIARRPHTRRSLASTLARAN